jgi:hypothetical protein
MVNKDLIHLLQMRRRVVLKRIQYFIKRNIQAWTHEERMIINEGPRVLANSTPKAGTNLLLNALQAMPNTVDRWSYHIDETLPGVEKQLRASRRGQIISSHLPWSQSIAKLCHDLNYRLLLIVRDPRDIAISNVNYVTRMDLSHPLHRIMASLPDDDTRLLNMIDPSDELLEKLPNIWKNYGLSTFLPWLDEPNCLIVRFEDLVGERGGGSDELQRNAIREIANHIGADVNQSFIDSIASGLFGNTGSKTFHKGQIGNWRSHFKSMHIKAFKSHSNQALLRLGYEQVLDW